MVDAAVIPIVVDYNKDNGLFTWRHRPRCMFPDERSFKTWNSRFFGKPALNTDNGDGYRCGEIFGISIKAHRAAWAWMIGAWPIDQIDHINGNRSDNRWLNLQPANFEQNARNAKLRVDNKSGYPGVYFKKSSMRWVAAIGSGKYRKHIGYFENLDDAVSAKKHHENLLGYSKRHGEKKS